MDSVVFSKQAIHTNDSELAYVCPLLERGLRCIQQGSYSEGAMLFAQVRDGLLPNQIELAVILDALNRAITIYAHAQHELHEASKRFAASDSEQQIQIVALKNLIPTLNEGIEHKSHEEVEEQKNGKSHPPLQLLRSVRAAIPANERDQHYAAAEDKNVLPALFITCFSHFEVKRLSPFDQLIKPINLCQNLKGQAILRYLVTQPKHQATMDMLTSVFWPEDTPEAASHKLRIAISALRCSLNKGIAREPGGGYILCRKQSSYELNPEVVLTSDVDEFLALYHAGKQASESMAMTQYERACSLYTGPFLTEDLYDDWSSMQREELSKIYVTMCEKLATFNREKGHYEAAIKWATAILRVDRCDEDAHRQLIRVYAAQGRRNDALRQYQQCQRVLSEEMGAQPMPETQKLFHDLMKGPIPSFLGREG